MLLGTRNEQGLVSGSLQALLALSTASIRGRAVTSCHPAQLIGQFLYQCCPMVQLKVEAEDAVVAERRQALEAEKAARARQLKQRAEFARQRVLEQASCGHLVHLPHSCSTFACLCPISETHSPAKCCILMLYQIAAIWCNRCWEIANAVGASLLAYAVMGRQVSVCSCQEGLAER